MHPAEIQYELKIRGITQKAIAREMGKSEMCISHEINGIPVSERIRQAIAKKIERDPKEVFHGYYSRRKRRRSGGRFKKLNLEKVEGALARTGGNKDEAAKLLGVGRATFYNFLAENREAA